MDWIQQWQSKLNKQNGVAPLVRTGGSRHTGLAALPYRNIHLHYFMDSKLIHGPPHSVSSSNKNPSLISR